jgi:hypothetical protein
MGAPANSWGIALQPSAWRNCHDIVVEGTPFTAPPAKPRNEKKPRQAPSSVDTAFCHLRQENEKNEERQKTIKTQTSE